MALKRKPKLKKQPIKEKKSAITKKVKTLKSSVPKKQKKQITIKKVSKIKKTKSVRAKNTKPKKKSVKTKKKTVIKKDRKKEPKKVPKKVAKKSVSKKKVVKSVKNIPLMKEDTLFILSRADEFEDVVDDIRNFEVIGSSNDFDFKEQVQEIRKTTRSSSLKNSSKIDNVSPYVVDLRNQFSSETNNIDVNSLRSKQRFITSMGDTKLKSLGNKVNKKSMRMTAYYWKRVARFFRKGKSEEMESLLEVNDFLQENVLITNKIVLKRLPIFNFIVLSIFIILPLIAASQVGKMVAKKEYALGATKEISSSLKGATEKINFLDLQNSLNEVVEAKDEFLNVQESLEEISGFYRLLIKLYPPGNKKFVLGENIIKIGVNATTAATEILNGLDIILNNKTKTLVEQIEYFGEKSIIALPYLENANHLLNEIENNDVPEKYQEEFNKIREFVPLLLNTTYNFLDVYKPLSEIIGSNEKKRYLIMFQNSTELRATGGFLGSFALLDINKGKIVNMEIPGGGAYDFNGSLTKNVISPSPLHLINTKWEFQDANWFVDWPTSAKKIMWFYEHGGGPTVDGVIAVNTFIFEDLLKLLGSVALPEYNMVVTHNNFLETLQQYVEFDYDKEENRPKKIIGELAPKIVDRVVNLQLTGYFDLTEVINNSLKEKNLLVYLKDTKLQQKVHEFGWDATVLSANKDYLQIVNTNIGGGKTDGKIKEDVILDSYVAENGEIINELKITRTHFGNKDNVFEGVKNISYLRAYVPEGSVLLEAEGFSKIPEIYFMSPDSYLVTDIDLSKIEKNERYHKESNTRVTEEFGKTVFGNWIEVDVGEQVVVILKYKLPFSLKQEETNPEKLSLLQELKEWYFAKEIQKPLYYSLLIQKQPGSWGDNFSINLHLSEKFKNLLTYPLDNVISDNNTVKYSTIINKDKYFSVILKNKED